MTYYVRVLAPDGEVDVASFVGPSFTIGSALSNDLVLDDRSVSDHHARLLVRSGLLFIEDTSSTSGTLVDGKPLRSMLVVREPHPITIGDHTLQIFDHEPPCEEESTFLAALERTPHDDDTRRVYADWLEERGRAEKAEMIRSQLELLTLAPEDPRFQAFSSRVAELAMQLPLAWRRTVARPPIEKCAVRFELVCPKRWDALSPTTSPKERYCDACKKNVHYAATIFEAQQLAERGECIAVDIAQTRYPNDLEARPPPMLAGMPVPPRPPTRK